MFFKPADSCNKTKCVETSPPPSKQGENFPLPPNPNPTNNPKPKITSKNKSTKPITQKGSMLLDLGSTA